jgi:radical SAM superfamily enzyme YgiQ (UPF0313 family)
VRTATRDPGAIFRVWDPAYARDNIYRHAARQTISLGPVIIASVAHKALPWLSSEVISENNYRWKSRKGPVNENGMPDHRVLQEEKPARFIGISASITNAAPRALEIVRLYRELPEALKPQAIIVGGWHAGDCPGEFLEAGADVVVHGEGVAIIARLLDTLRQAGGLADVPGISYRDNGQVRRNAPEFLALSQEELGALPDPDFNLVHFAKLKVVPVSRTWGCSGRCRFCRVKNEPRSISPERFAQNIKDLVSKGFRHFFVVDDRSEEDMAGFKVWLQEMADFRRERKVRRLGFTLQARLSLAEEPDVLELMRQAGVQTAAIGFESPIPEEVWAMRKPIVPEKMIEWTKIWKRHGFYIHAMFIFAYPIPPDKKQPLNASGQTMSARERAQAFWRFIKAANPDTIQILALTPIPGTEDWDFLDKENRIFKELGWAAWDGLHVVFQPDEGMSPQEVQDEVVRLHRKFYAFRYLGSLGIVSLLAHLVNVGVTTISMPFIWLFIMPSKWPFGGSFVEQAKLAWQRPSRSFRNARRHFGAYLVVQNVQKKLARFNDRLGGATRKEDED